MVNILLTGVHKLSKGLKIFHHQTMKTKKSYSIQKSLNGQSLILKSKVWPYN